MLNKPCPCQSGLDYQNCCEPLHKMRRLATNAAELMRSRYCAYALSNVQYVVATTLPAQQSQLDVEALQHWADNTQWQGLEILHQQALSPIHYLVEFNAYFQDAGEQPAIHHEYSLFVYSQNRWFFVDPTLTMPPAKQPCFCGSRKKFKHCCGAFL